MPGSEISLKVAEIDNDKPLNAEIGGMESED